MRQGRHYLKGAAELSERSDRWKQYPLGLRNSRVEHRLFPDGIGIRGGKLAGGTVNSFGDHRIAMSWAIAGHVACSPVVIKDCDPMKVSFPNFITTAQKLGINISNVYI